MQPNELPNLDQFLNNSLQDDDVIPVYEAITKQDEGDRFTTGFDAFNKVMNGGLKEGDLAVLSGISGEGKTTFAGTLTYYLCRDAIPVLWFSYEVPPDFLNKQFQQMGLNSFYLAYTPRRNTTGKIEWIKEKILESWTKYFTKVIIIDHLDFILGSDVKDSDTQAIAFKKIATELKTLAVELKVAIISIAHLRKVPPGKEPDMQDIGYSAGIFQLSDYVFIIQREKVKNEGGLKGEKGYLYTNNSFIKLAKNRETGQLIYLKCVHNNGKFETHQPNEDPTNF